LIGRASVIDGDTIEIQGERVRLNGIDAPESAQLCNDASGKSYRCGAVAAQALSAFLAKSSPTKCEYVERDQYGRFVGNCLRADGSSVAAWLVRNGHALDWRRYSNGAYAADQKTAAAAKVGLWAGTFQSPWEWRAEQSSIVEVPAPAMPIAPLTAMRKTGKCEIKGNISNKGERIYHTPGQKFYSRTRISESKGEHWFCSEAEARAAGWRRALR
jgi:endonuclease YncB( thermonuclease family)